MTRLKREAVYLVKKKASNTSVDKWLDDLDNIDLGWVSDVITSVSDENFKTAYAWLQSSIDGKKSLASAMAVWNHFKAHSTHTTMEDKRILSQ